MKFKSPTLNASFAITSGPVWPSVAFETDATGAHTWTWAIQWGSFKKSGTVQTPGNTWDAQTVIANFGGTLTVGAAAGKDSASITVKIIGTNPSAAEVNTYLATKPGSDGFDKLLQHESGFKNFKDNGEAVKSFDNGYGMCQLTSPPPSFEQKWNWKLNVDGGLATSAMIKRLQPIRTRLIMRLREQKKGHGPDERCSRPSKSWALGKSRPVGLG